MAKKATEAEEPVREIVRVPDLEQVERVDLAVIPQAPKERYQGASLLKLSKEEAVALDVPFADDDHDILPTGEVYVSHVHVRRRLNHTLGPGQWALIPDGEFKRDEKKQILFREFGIYVRGYFVGSTVGEAEYHEGNARMSWATAAEIAKSNALTRACKDLGIASECWDRHWTEKWKKKFAIKVFVKGYKDDKAKVCWRRRDADPLPYEQGQAIDKKTAEKQYDEKQQAAGTPTAKPATGEAPKGKPVGPGPSTALVSIDQVTVLMDACTESGVPKAVLEKIVMSEAGVVDVERIPLSRYDTILKVIRTMKKASR